MKQYNDKNIKGISSDNELTVFKVSFMYMGMKPEIKAANKDAELFFVMCFEMRKTTNTRLAANKFGMVLTIKSNGRNFTKNAVK
jgi:hypothetical protein